MANGWRIGSTDGRGSRLRRGLWAGALGLTAFFAVGCSTTLAPPPKAGSTAPYRVGAPDRLNITVLPEPEIRQGAVVRPDGMISVELIGDVSAGGRTAEEIAADIEQRISRFKRDAKVTVAVEQAQSTAITVLGEVKIQKSFPLAKETRVAEAIGAVGGVSDWGFASSRNVRVIRSHGGETAVYKVDLTAIQKGDLRTNIVLVRGDIVYVPPTLWAKVGYVFQAILFPFQPFLGVATSAAGNLVTP
ncbi:MAG: polysaccharide biosynthesis/export family protein [Myxococcota bacterium]